MPDRLVARLAGAALRLPPTRPGVVRVTRDIPVRVRDGVVLRTDHYAPAVPDAPTVLIRTPYGRGGPLRLLGRLLAARGQHAVIQSCRGTGGSGGTFAPLVHERDDGVDTLDWLRRQPWWSGGLGMFGVSYQGFAQWALAADAGDELRAMVAVVTASATRDSTYAGESFALDTVLTWAELLHAQTVPWLARQWELKRGQPRLAAALEHLPLAGADRVATGVTIPFFQEWLRHHTPDAEYWRTRVFADRVARVRAPVILVTGWHDIFLPAQLDDHATLRATGARPRLVIGPWTHGSPGLFVAALREGLAWLDEHLTGTAVADGRPHRPASASAPVRLHVNGPGGGWRDLPDWPPPAVDTAWHLHPGGELAARGPVPSPPDGFRYDPADPTLTRWTTAGGTAGRPGGQPEHRGPRRRADVHHRPADRPGRGDRPGTRRDPRPQRVAVPGRLRPIVRCGPSWPVVERVRRAGPGRARPVRRRRVRGTPDPGAALADRVPVRRRAPTAVAGLRWRAPALGAQPGYR
ncbi:hypothetical protein GCM10027614_24370 [Micromonospora vulcania]